MGDDHGYPACQRVGRGLRPFAGFAADRAEDRRFGLFHALRRIGRFLRGASQSRSREYRCRAGDSARFRAQPRRGRTAAREHFGQRGERHEGHVGNAVPRADGRGLRRRAARRAGIAGATRSRRGREPLQSDARIPQLHDSGADDHAAYPALRLSSGAEPRGGKGDGHYRTDQRHARESVRLYAGEADPLLGDRPRGADAGHVARLGGLRPGPRRVARRRLPGCGAFHLRHVGIRCDRGQLFGDHAADHVRHVLFRDDLHPDERPADPRRVDARMGAADHLVPAAPTSSASCGRFTSRGRPSPISGPTMRLSRSSPCCSTFGRR